MAAHPPSAFITAASNIPLRIESAPVEIAAAMALGASVQPFTNKTPKVMIHRRICIKKHLIALYEIFLAFYSVIL